jgi:hypothetical protein
MNPTSESTTQQERRLSRRATTFADPLASLNRCSKNVFVKAVTIFELTFCDVERQIFAADLVIAANDTAFEDAPKALNRIGLHRTNNVLARAVLDGLVGIIVQAGVSRRILRDAAVAAKFTEGAPAMGCSSG